ncbi:cyclic pyranopterin monophosphate synthase MoaC [bacterium (Candidatus Blackallbacteria) CG17_big_fil_post_rev_8_21_14_2_50_48_46]|uniref:cyclic pyranopterin monophosphate synthase n=1 Tax=bacterium (Candidatus Blackallbacteria) CG17_big_fil_post_rev_8_21_14_2_50_48_46 TaxID=2014261 RepID=A0A2M7G0A5_9BACT|nr:MAG: cyclic pyranopterin monophosphate synthase MoaC [bacterium (Candidatus Blackallbacteria) CG18_big_fil_WC_8_21_14_2_50_49_26]PIW15106.1 MAG: cyclic pyranopterin monophosphate synthase MoaC [bacterium (Candidatus Blackallbacteria) CG17_big_fil_post_rev_8_21_14_2_50_48_46]PIW47660.1 MAG: cyclic pyranopterin monophosphate synthase MoaC [bacterium (Candidatus Blackallbacteria) CG13_big_fil_rev_8_21_14_2_50_49_14]
MPGLSHIDAQNLPTMVDIGGKKPTRREAIAQTLVILPPEILACLTPEGEVLGPKGPVFQTAIIAGTMAVKRTHDLIPFCHPLPIENCKIEIEFYSENQIAIRCSVCVTHKTGVEMEALTGATVAALTVYDMCKALSHLIVIQETRLLSKTGGKCDYQASEDTPS